MIESLDIPADELTFSALAAGPEDGKLVILLHGFPQTARAWRSQLERLAESGVRAIAPDLRGFCDGARPDGLAAYSLDRAAQDVLAIAAWAGADSFDLVGHDLGGIIGWELACRYSQRVRTATIASTPHLTPFAEAIIADEAGVRVPPFALFREPGAAELALLADDGAALRSAYTGIAADAVEEYVRVFTAPGVLTATLAHFRAFDFQSWLELPSSPVPTLFVWGRDDPFLDPATAAATAGHADGSYRGVGLAGVGHWLPELAADSLAGLILEQIA